MRKKGSYTIEAALLMPFIIGVIVFVIYAAYYTHDRAVLQKCAYIAALRGSQVRTGDQDTYGVAKENCEELLQNHLLGNWELSDSVEVDVSSVTVSYIGNMQIPGGILIEQLLGSSKWKTKKEAGAYRIDEPLYIRKVRKANE